MGKYFDFQQPALWGGGIPLGETLSGIADDRDKARELEQKLAIEKAKADAYTAQVAATNQSQRGKDVRDQVAFAQTQQDRERQTTQAISAALGGGRYGEAEGLAASSQFQDPRHPGQTRGITFAKQAPGPAPVAPEDPGPAPVAPERPVFPAQDENDYYKVMTPEAARAQAMSRALGGATQPPAPGSGDELMSKAAGAGAAGVAQRAQQERGQYADQALVHDINQKDFDARSQSYGADKAAFDKKVAHPNVTLGYPGGGQVTINPQEAGDYKEEQARLTASRLLESADKEADPVVAATMRRQASMVMAQLAGADKGAINNAATAATAAGARGTLQDKKLVVDERIQGGHDRARVAAAALRGHGGGMLPGAEEGRVTSEFQHNTADITQKGGLRDQVRHQEASMSALREHPENNTNWTNAIDAMIRSNTGRAAIIAQYKMYTGKAASAEDAGAQFLEWATTGALSPDQKRSLFGAMRDSYNGTVDEWNEANDVAGEYDTDPRVLSSPALQASIKRSQHAAFPGGKRKRATDTTVPGLPNTPLTKNPAPTPPSGGKIDPKDQVLIDQAHAEIAKKGPHSASAKALLDHLGVQ